jgi:hypothetical protein
MYTIVKFGQSPHERPQSVSKAHYELKASGLVRSMRSEFHFFNQ